MRGGRRHHHRRAWRWREKINQMRAVRRRRARALHGVKRAFDPKALLNLGKAVPTLARCAEYGRMRVHGGKLPHPELAVLTVQDFQDLDPGRFRRRAPGLRGGGTKDFYGNAPRGEVLDTRGYAGIVSYEPTELVVTARGGIRFLELEKALEQWLQYLSNRRIRRRRDGGRLHCCRAVRAATRRGRRAARFRARREAHRRPRPGARFRRAGDEERGGLRLSPCRRLARHARPHRRGVARRAAAANRGDAASRSAARARARARQPLAGQPLPVSATAWYDGELSVRLSGSEPAGAAPGSAEARRRNRSGTPSASRPIPSSEPSRLAARASSAPPVDLLEGSLVEWNGALRWFKSDEKAGAVREAARRLKGHATLFAQPTRAKAASRRSSRWPRACTAVSRPPSTRTACSIPGGCTRRSKAWRAFFLRLHRATRLLDESAFRETRARGARTAGSRAPARLPRQPSRRLRTAASAARRSGVGRAAAAQELQRVSACAMKAANRRSEARRCSCQRGASARSRMRGARSPQRRPPAQDLHAKSIAAGADPAR